MSFDPVSYAMGKAAGGGGGGGGGGILPSGYTQLQYIESTGTQYIDSGVSDSSGMLCILDGCFVEKEADVDWATLCGVETANHDQHQIFVGKFGSDDYYDSGMAGVQNTNIQIIYGTTQLFISDTRNSYNYMSMNGVRYYRQAFGTLTGLSVGLFALKAGTNWQAHSKGRIGRVRFYGNTGTLLGDFYAAKRNSDGALGLYDLVTSTFFTNQGTGTFVAGPAV